MDLLVDVIPAVIHKYPNVRFILGGDGPKMNLLQEMIDKYNIADKVEILGAVPHEKVRDVFCRGHIFLNTSLTEAFCSAILEAASCGLLCVSTNVGGVPEVLPPSMIFLAQPKPTSLIEKVDLAIKSYEEKGIPYFDNHEKVKDLYSWHKTTQRLEKVYSAVQDMPVLSMLMRMKLTLTVGPLAGVGAMFVYIVMLTVSIIHSWFFPKESIEPALEFDTDMYRQNPGKFGDHECDMRKPMKADGSARRTRFKIKK